MSKGLTFLELLIVLSLLLILQAILSPSLHRLLVQNRIQLMMSQIKHEIYEARMQALHRQQTVRLCGSAHQRYCDGKWDQGQLILANSSGAVLRQYPAMKGECRLVWRSSFGRNQFLDFTAEGFTLGQQGTFYCCANKESIQYSQALVLTRSGRIRNFQDLKKLEAFCSDF